MEHGVTFDSSHFVDGLWLEQKVKGLTNNGQYVQAIDHAFVSNRIVGFNYPPFNGSGEKRTDMLQVYMTNQNYSFLLKKNWNWDYIDIADSLESATVFYENSHGNEFCHYVGLDPHEETDDFYGRIIDDPSSSTTVEGIHNYEYWRAYQNGTGLPPFNSTSHPPVTFAQMDSCESGGTWAGPAPGFNKFASLLYPYYNAWYPGIETPDQAVLTWKAYTARNTTENGVYWIYTQMRQGMTISQARKNLVDHNGQPGYDYPVHVSLVANPNFSWQYQRLSSLSQVPIWGEKFARIKHVYTAGTSLPSSLWFSPPLPVDVIPEPKS